MELLRQVSSTQFMFPAAAVAVVLICAGLVFIFGFHSAEQPQFDKLPLVLDDRKSSNKKRKTKDKKSSPNRVAAEDTKAKNENSKKSPTKEKKEDKVKESEKPKPKERPTEPKFVKKEPSTEGKKGKKNKSADTEKPADFDDAGWQEVPVKTIKKKVKGDEKEKDKDEKKKDSPTKQKNKKKFTKEADVEAAHQVEESKGETIRVISAEGPDVDEEAARALQAQVAEFQRVLKEAELRDQSALGGRDNEEVEELTEAKDLRSNKKKENIEKQNKKKVNENATKSAPKPEPVDAPDAAKDENQQSVPVFDELGDTWTDTKAAKKGKKKARKE